MNYNHLSQIIRVNTKRYGEEEVLKIRDAETKSWQSISWNNFQEKTSSLAQAMVKSGIKPQDHIGVYSQNKAECIVVDFALFCNRAISVPMYPTASTLQINYMIEEAEIQVVFVGEQAQYDNALQVLKTSNYLKQIIIFDKEVVLDKEDTQSVYFEDFCSPENLNPSDLAIVENRMKEGKPEDIAHLIYTSGTTGESKGVMIAHSNYLTVFRIHDIRLDYLKKRFLSVSFLPMAHIFEKAWSLYCLHRGCSIAINLDPREIQACIKEVHPEAMCSVPRFWEKVYAGVQEQIENAGFIKKKLLKNAIHIGKKHNVDCINEGKEPGFFTKKLYQFYDKTIYSYLKKVVGIENGIIFPCAGAFLSNKITLFMRSVNIPIVIGYGLTETTATVSCFPPVGYEIGTVGTVMPELEVRIGDENEIQLKGETIMKGYYKKPEATKDAFTEDGWFKTGDAGRLTPQGSIVLHERIKDLHKTSNGKYIAPQQLEGRLMDDKYVESAIIIADQRKFVSALIAPDFNELKKYAELHHIAYQTYEDLISQKQIVKLFDDHIKNIQHEFANYEQIKRFALLTEPFSIAGGELTNTLKMKRAYIAEKYSEIINKIYEE